MLTAPSGPMTATSAVGHAKLKSARMCFELMTSYAPPYALRVITVSFGTVASAVRVQQLRAVADDAAPLLLGARQEAGTSTNVTSGMLNASQVRTKRAALFDASMSSTPARTLGWLPTMPTAYPSRRAKPAHDVGGPALVHLEELAVVDHAADDVVHVVRLVRVVGNERVELGVLARRRVGRRRARRPARALFCGRNESR